MSDNKTPGMYVIDRENDYFLRGLEYLTEVVILSQCKNIVAGRTTGTAAANILTNGYQNKYYFFLGRYGMVGDA